MKIIYVNCGCHMTEICDPRSVLSTQAVKKIALGNTLQYISVVFSLLNQYFLSNTLWKT